ncbi:glycosyltransferase [Mycolicibacterium litorale]|uniref:Glycosyl transferase n=1 Tax=Mycolicibacterium litorale TaxID=758802 RepID=A0AAD1IL34_9MYCO|nr:nucleotide disphospho-sugar-binding domain-containing protein [Mycolicibacterium litorale]MCV7416104.1 glycosyltransferase [Mycolicibacterium litorale]TDY09355.1 MGT family glycosyltransferase [Mycolicibacterium litorale]BBY17300.1 glycosyl transferase [Mycolicibacterium litorale]
MATILAYTSPSAGHLFPMLALLGELAGRGHRVHVRTYAAGVPVARAAGMAADTVDPRIEAIVSEDWRAGSGRAVLRMTIDTFGARGAHELADVDDAVARVGPDVLVLDINCWGAMAVAEASRLPWAVFSPYTPFLTSPGMPPVGAGMAPRRGPVGWVRDLGVRTVVRRVFDVPMMGHVNVFRAQRGLPALSDVDAVLRRAPLMLVAGGEPFEYPHPGWGDAVQMIGPCEFDPAAADTPEWLDAVDMPVVLVTTSSVKQADSALVATALTALADAPVHVVATCPAGIPDGIVVPPNATVTGFLPHGPVLDRAICAITHGGMGVTQKALARGVPVCAVPYGRDQFEVARRVEAARCGTRIPARRLTPPRLRAGVERALAMTAGARRVADGFAATGGVARGADLVEQRVIRRSVSRSAPLAPGAVRPSS